MAEHQLIAGITENSGKLSTYLKKVDSSNIICHATIVPFHKVYADHLTTFQISITPKVNHAQRTQKSA